jgi:hypothetical protein
MDDAVRVSLDQGLEHLPANVDDALRRHRGLAADDLIQRIALGELHDQVEVVIVGLAKVDESDDVRVAQRRDRASFLLKARHNAQIAERRRVEDLDGDVAADGELGGAEHVGHPAARDELVDLVAAGEDRADERGRLVRLVVFGVYGLEAVPFAHRHLGVLPTLWTDPHRPPTAVSGGQGH